MAAKADSVMGVPSGMDPKIYLRRLHEAHKKMLDKTFEELSFEEFAAGFGTEMAGRHRDYLFDLYSQFVSMTRSNTEEEFGVIVFQTDLEEKLTALQAMIAQQPEGNGGVAHAAQPPSVLIRAQRMAEKDQERRRLEGCLAEMDKENDTLRPLVHEKQDAVARAAADLRERKAKSLAMTSTLAPNAPKA